MKDALLKLEEAAARLGVSRTTIHNYIKKGDLKVVRIGSSIRIQESEFQKFIGERARRGGKEP